MRLESFYTCKHLPFFSKINVVVCCLSLSCNYEYYYQNYSVTYGWCYLPYFPRVIPEQAWEIADAGILRTEWFAGHRAKCKWRTAGHK